MVNYFVAKIYKVYKIHKIKYRFFNIFNILSLSQSGIFIFSYIISYKITDFLSDACKAHILKTLLFTIIKFTNIYFFKINKELSFFFPTFAYQMIKQGTFYIVFNRAYEKQVLTLSVIHDLIIYRICQYKHKCIFYEDPRAKKTT